MMSSSDKNNCSQCQNKKTIQFNNSKKRQPTTSLTANNVDYNIPSTSTAQYDRPSSPEDASCVNIRFDLTFV
eukprot:XP_016660073.1 PREDICTED: uncharacterized protein LOC100568530 isoform X2 [Acyrthosiphon pisum]